jgi:hypothetical protein
MTALKKSSYQYNSNLYFSILLYDNTVSEMNPYCVLINVLTFQIVHLLYLGVLCMK